MRFRVETLCGIFSFEISQTMLSCLTMLKCLSIQRLDIKYLNMQKSFIAEITDLFLLYNISSRTSGYVAPRWHCRGQGHRERDDAERQKQLRVLELVQQLRGTIAGLRWVDTESTPNAAPSLHAETRERAHRGFLREHCYIQVSRQTSDSNRINKQSSRSLSLIHLQKLQEYIY